MTTLTSLARTEAVAAGQAQLIRTVRHVHISDRPLVFIPLELAGEACAPIAAMIGDDPSEPRLLVVPSPLNPDDRLQFAAALAAIALPYIDSYAASPPGDTEPYPGAPQLIVPNPGGVRFTALLGRSTRFRRASGQWAVPSPVPVLGTWLTYLAERFEHPGSSLALTATGALAEHWATGQSASEDQNLATLLAWIDPPAGVRGEAAARLAEDPVTHPPAGPATDPSFDREVLRGLYEEIQRARASGDQAAGRRARLRLDRELDRVLRPTWELMWRAVGLLRSLPEGEHVAERWGADRGSFTGQARYARDGGLPQAKRDSAVAAARRLARLEDERQRLDAQMAYDDRLVMAEYRMTGEAFEGVVVEVEYRHDESGARARPRPWVWVRTGDHAAAIEAGAEVRSSARPAQKAIVREVTRLPEATLVKLELQDQMGRRRDPEPGTVPQPDEVRCYTRLKLEFRRPPQFPEREDTPWTHGGPPAQYVPTDADAAESWAGSSWEDS